MEILVVAVWQLEAGPAVVHRCPALPRICMSCYGVDQHIWRGGKGCNVHVHRTPHLGRVLVSVALVLLLTTRCSYGYTLLIPYLVLSFLSDPNYGHFPYFCKENLWCG